MQGEKLRYYQALKRSFEDQFTDGVRCPQLVEKTSKKAALVLTRYRFDGLNSFEYEEADDLIRIMLSRIGYSIDTGHHEMAALQRRELGAVIDWLNYGE